MKKVKFKMKDRSKFYLKFLIIISLVIFLIGVVFSCNEIIKFRSEIPIDEEDVKSVLMDYSKSLSTEQMTSEKNYSPMMKKLINERREFYKEFFDIGLNSDLLNIESEYSIESITKDDKQKNVYKVETVETVTMNGKYRCSSPEDYPLVKAGRLALTKTENPAVKKEIESYIKSMIDGANNSINEGSFEIVNFLKHDLIIKSNKNGPMIIQDSFTDKANDNPEGHDNISWVNGKFVRKKQDLTQMPDYVIWHTPIEELAENILDDYSRIYFIDFTEIEPRLTLMESYVENGITIYKYKIRGREEEIFKINISNKPIEVYMPPQHRIIEHTIKTIIVKEWFTGGIINFLWQVEDKNIYLTGEAIVPLSSDKYLKIVELITEYFMTN